MHEAYRRMAQRFDVTLSSFERKRYANLSHEPNKAMNLNSYIGCLGGARGARHAGGVHLVPARPGDGRLVVPEPTTSSPWTQTASSCRTTPCGWSHLMERPGNERRRRRADALRRVPRCARRARADRRRDDRHPVPHPPGLHPLRATFWVGANALVRAPRSRTSPTIDARARLRVRRYIQDRTVIEDTESTIDLRCQGLAAAQLPRAARLQRHAAGLRLAADPAPPLGQRRPAHSRQALARGGEGDRPGQDASSEALFRLHYLTSLAASNMALLILLAYGFDDRLVSVWLPVTADSLLPPVRCRSAACGLSAP